MMQDLGTLIYYSSIKKRRLNARSHPLIIEQNNLISYSLSLWI